MEKNNQPKEHTCSECWWYTKEKECILGMTDKVELEPSTPACRRFDT